MTIEIQGIAPLLQVFDMRAAIAFYRDKMGFEVAYTSEPRPEVLFHFALLKRDSMTLMLNTAYDEGERPPVPDPARVAAHQDTALYFGCADIDGLCAELSSKGVAVTEKPFITGYGMKRFSVADPDGYILSFQRPLTENEKVRAAS